MNTDETKLSWDLVAKFTALVKPYWQGEKKRQAWWLLFLLIVFISLMALVTAYKTYVSKWAINALSDKNQREFYRVIGLAVISLFISMPIVALKLYYENKLGLFWRRWFNLSLLSRFFKSSAYYKMSLYSNVDNPDQRIADDLNNFVNSSTRFFSILLLSIISVMTYIWVLGSISVWLVVSVFFYAIAGTAIIVFLSKRLVLLNFKNIRLQADYRYNLVHVRDNTESIAFYKGEQHESSVLKRGFKKLINNYNDLIILQKNISFFQESYTLFSALIPFLLLAPSMFKGKIEVGTIVQASTVFTILLNDLSIIVNEFNTLSTLAAVVQRLSGFMTGIEAKGPESEKIGKNTGHTFEFKNVTVRTPDLKKTLISDLNLSVNVGTGMMIVGPSGCGKSSLLRAIAGLWENGQGQITTPSKDQLMFLPQKPYMLMGTLREQLIYPHLDSEVCDAELASALKDVGLDDLIERVDRLGSTMKWADLLSLGEQQRIIFLRLLLTKPKFAILDESTSALDEPNEALVYRALKQSGITFISVGHRSSIIEFHDSVLRMDGASGWEVYTKDEYLNYKAQK